MKVSQCAHMREKECGIAVSYSITMYIIIVCVVFTRQLIIDRLSMFVHITSYSMCAIEHGR